jgi:hypothetical protein
MPFQQVNQFVDQNVLGALNRLLRQFQVEPDPPRIDAARTPLGLHLLDPALAHLHAEAPLPFVEEWLDQILQMLAVPAVKYPLSLVGVTSFL